MCQYLLVFRALVRQRFDDGSLEMNHFRYFRQLVKLLYREMEDINKDINEKNSKKVKKRSRKAKNKN